MGPEGVHFGKRLGAWAIDYLLLGLAPVVGIGFALAASLPKELAFCEDFDGDTYLCETLTDRSAGILILSLLGLFLLYATYIIASDARGGGLGKKALGIRVADQATGENIGVGKAMLRFLVGPFATILCCLGFIGHLWNLWDGRKQTLADKAASAIVIDR